MVNDTDSRPPFQCKRYLVRTQLNPSAPFRLNNSAMWGSTHHLIRFLISFFQLIQFLLIRNFLPRIILISLYRPTTDEVVLHPDIESRFPRLKAGEDVLLEFEFANMLDGIPVDVKFSFASTPDDTVDVSKNCTNYVNKKSLGSLQMIVIFHVQCWLKWIDPFFIDCFFILFFLFRFWRPTSKQQLLDSTNFWKMWVCTPAWHTQSNISRTTLVLQNNHSKWQIFRLLEIVSRTNFGWDSSWKWRLELLHWQLLGSEIVLFDLIISSFASNRTRCCIIIEFYNRTQLILL